MLRNRKLTVASAAVFKRELPAPKAHRPMKQKTTAEINYDVHLTEHKIKHQLSTKRKLRRELQLLT